MPVTRTLESSKGMSRITTSANPLLTFGRKMMKCYLELSDLQAATQVFEHMAPDRKRHPLSQYVRYSLALRCQDDAAGQVSVFLSE